MSLPITYPMVFHPKQCPDCAYYDPNEQTCRANEAEPDKLTAGDDGTTDPCSRFEAAMPGSDISQIAAAVAATEGTELLVASESMDIPVEPVAVGPENEETEPILSKPIRGEAQIHCQRCKSENPPTAERCQNCDANLLAAEGIGTRIITFFSFILVAAVIGFLLYLFNIKNPGSAPDIVFFNPVVLSLSALMAVATAFGQLFRRTPTYLKYQNRANRHIQLNLWQSLDDLNRAIELAPDKEQGKLVYQRASVYEKLGLANDAARDRLALAVSQDAFKGEGDLVSLITGADSGVYTSTRRSDQISNLLQSGKARAIGYCPKCKTVLHLNVEQRCPTHLKVKGQAVIYVIPADVLSGKLAVMQNMEAGHPLVAEQLNKLLLNGKAKAVGYCRQCKAAVELDPQRHCRVHPKTGGKMVQYVVPENIAAAKQTILKQRRAGKGQGRTTALYIFALIMIAFALMVLMDVDFAAILVKLINVFR